MFLAVDIGNTNVVAGVFSGDTVISHWRLATDVRRTADEYAASLEQLFRLSHLDIDDVDGVAVCSVVPIAQTMLCDGIKKYWNLVPLIITLDLDLGISVEYTPRLGVGTDRIANAVAAVDRFGTPTVVVDFGTATTFDAISAGGTYVGGAIAPGLEISEEALYAHTAQLPRVHLEIPPHAIGTSTISSLQSGILFGYAGLVDGLVDRFRAELGAGSHVIATGGLAGTISPHTRTVQHVDPDLTLTGLRLLYQRNVVAAH